MTDKFVKFSLKGDPSWTVKQRCAECVKGGNLVKTVIIAVCVGVLIQQLSVCIRKLIHIPITTYTHFDFNKTIYYPSLTFCREPPYKYDKLLDYGLYSHPRYTSTWASFNFSDIVLDELWEEITYNENDIFVQYGLYNLKDNVKIKPKMQFVMGRCYTLSPNILNTDAAKATGYSITLQHSAADIETSTSVYPPGYHVHVHYTREPFTEVEVYNGGLVDYLYVNVGETIDVKLKVDEYVKISSDDELCTNEDYYSANVCTEEYVWKKVIEQVGCSGPWMDCDVSRCDNYTSMRNLISAYLKLYAQHDCEICPRFCRSLLYNAYVADRQSSYTWDPADKKWLSNAGALQTQLNLYFNSMMVSVYEERYNYDWNLFLSDLGGSIGFLLGLSVVGLLEILEKTWQLFIRPHIQDFRKKKTSIDSSATADIDTLQKNREFLQKYIDWNTKNVEN
ncbi:hypothetical protein K1T71_008025 [Dendrolimus kikuchii]|uniref:Uncharacterized protein n=1 Tax=Dendrolimus kikuchii TaxID=765133 RepID=A0ACC1CZ23_9NEOP|nr:hypothetical protein K1T71_008025 [Dendrolimus kikuchii]